MILEIYAVARFLDRKYKGFYLCGEMCEIVWLV